MASRAGELRPAKGIAHNAECDVGLVSSIQRYAQALLIRLGSADPECHGAQSACLCSGSTTALKRVWLLYHRR